jgi:hypothetical protein
MRRYLLDTSPLAALLLARPAAVALITPWMERHEAATSILAPFRFKQKKHLGYSYRAFR